MKKYSVLIFLLSLISSGIAQNDEILESLIQNKCKEYAIKELRVSIITEDTSYLKKIKRFDIEGRVIEDIDFWKTETTRKRFKYDSFGRITQISQYAKEDSTILVNEWYWFYVDSTHFRREEFGYDHKLVERVERSIKQSGDTVWTTHLTSRPPFKTIDKKIVKHTSRGDSLYIREHANFRESLITSINFYYDLFKKDSIGNTIHTSGIGELKHEQFRESRELQRGFLSDDPEFLQRQFNGEFDYALKEYRHKYEVINPNGNLISKNEKYRFETFEYDSQNRIVKKRLMKKNKFDANDASPMKEIYYEYYKNSLPKSIQEKDFRTKRMITYVYEYK